MEKYYNLIIVTTSKVTLEGYDYLVINEDIIIIDDHHLQYQGETYEFTSLIFTNEVNVKYPSNLFIQEDDIITNFFHQTSMENIYYVKHPHPSLIIKEIIEEN